MNNRFFQRARKALPGYKTTFLVGACHAVAGGVLSLLASACALAASQGAPNWIPLAAVANEQATPTTIDETAKPTVAATAVAATADSASSSRMSTHAAAPTAWKTTPDGFAPLSYFAANCARCHGPNGSFYGDSFARTRDDASLRQIVHDMAFGPAQAPIDDPKLEVLTAYHRSLIDKKPFLSLSSAVVGSTAKGSPKSVARSGIAPNGGKKPATARLAATSEKLKKSGTTPKAPPAKSTSRKADTAKVATTKVATTKVATTEALTTSTKPILANTSAAQAAQAATGEIVTLQGEATPGARVTLTQGGRSVEAQRVGDTWKASLPIDSVSSQIEITAKKDGLETVLRLAQKAFSHSTTQAKNAGAESSNTNDSKSVDGKK